MLWELPKHDTEIWSEQMLLKKITPTDLVNAGLPQTFNLQKKKKKHTQYVRSTEEENNKVQ